MATITSVDKNDFALLADLGKQTFLESHGHAGSKADIDSYVEKTYNYAKVEEELKDAKNIHHFIYAGDRLAGYSKIIPGSPNSVISLQNITKLERIYLLKEFYYLKLGFELLAFNIDLSKQHNQAGMWLFTWIENYRAVKFYLNNGFEIVGSYDFRVSENRSNPNHQMFLKY